MFLPRFSFLKTLHSSFLDVGSDMVHRGPVKNRSCTDIVCLIIFIAFLFGWGIIGFYGKHQLEIHFQSNRVLSRHSVIVPHCKARFKVAVIYLQPSFLSPEKGSIFYVFFCLPGFKLGDPQRLLHPTDSNGRTCGVDETVKDKPFLFYFDLTKCADPSVLIKGCQTPQVRESDVCKSLSF